MRVEQPGPKRLLNDLVARHLAGRPVAVLEAGGGSHTFLDLGPIEIETITTVDISPEQLERNTYANEKILDDLQVFRATRHYDLVVLHNVLEHIPRADQAMENLVVACAENGLIVIGGPVSRAFSGFVTRLTPHWFHVFVYRFAMRDRNAGKPGHAPFRTYFHPMSQPDRLRAKLEAEGFECLFLTFFEGNVYRKMARQRPLVGLLLIALTSAINILTPKRYNARHGDFCAIFRRKAA